MLARPSLGARASRMVPPSARRLDQIRRESAQGVPGYISARFRGVGGRRVDGGAQGCGAVLDRPRRADFSGRTPPPPAGTILALAARGSAGAPSGYDLSGRGLYAAQDDDGAGQSRLYSVLYLLHLA